MIENAIISLLAKDSTVVSTDATLDVAVTGRMAAYSAAIKALAGDPPRAYRVTLPRDSEAQIEETGAGASLPAILIGRQDTARGHTHGGPGALTNAVVEVHAIARDSLTCQQILAAVRKLLDFWQGTAGSNAAPNTSVYVERIFVESGRDIPQEPLAAEELPLAQSSINLNCWYREILA